MSKLTPEENLIIREIPTPQDSYVHKFMFTNVNLFEDIKLSERKNENVQQYMPQKINMDFLYQI